MLSRCVGRNIQAGVIGKSSPFRAEKEANSFLKRSSRHKRSLYHECYVEGCSFHEVDEVLSYEGSNNQGATRYGGDFSTVKPEISAEYRQCLILLWIFGHVKKLTNFPLFLKSRIMNTTGPLLQLHFLVIVSLTFHTILCLSSDDQTNVDDVLSPYSTEKEANSFLDSRSRKKRTLWEECYGEGCTFWEAAYYYGNWDSTREYLYDMACNKWPCETGCRCERAHPGYRDSGPHWRVCNDINECRTNKGGCREDQYCVNRHCGYSCPE
uniref:Uncharacterized protein n=1 Tax=Branchiostoma floridae TaxID=7739 RepID=C3YT88_BRAFL|eukprot:XP_002600443.1 hypothetical protein BRAFLDRAFT_109203 [Branchiostoma floridae]